MCRGTVLYTVAGLLCGNHSASRMSKRKHGEFARPTSLSVPRAADALQHVPVVVSSAHASETLATEMAAARKKAYSSAKGSVISLKAVTRRLVLRVTASVGEDSGIGLRWVPFRCNFYDRQRSALFARSAKGVRVLALDFPHGFDPARTDELLGAWRKAIDRETRDITDLLREASPLEYDQREELACRVTAVAAVFERIFYGLRALPEGTRGVAISVLPRAPPVRFRATLHAGAEEVEQLNALRDHDVDVGRFREALASRDGVALHGGAMSARVEQKRIPVSQLEEIKQHEGGVAAMLLGLPTEEEGAPALVARQLPGFGARHLPLARAQGIGNGAYARDDDGVVVCSTETLRDPTI